MSDAIKTRTIRLFRLDEDGVRIPWLIEVDQTLLVVDERKDEEAIRTMREATLPAHRPAAAGSSIAPRTNSRIMAQWVTETIENPVPGTDDLRAEFFRERDAMIAKYAETDEPCPSCHLGKLQNRYRGKMEDLGLI